MAFTFFGMFLAFRAVILVFLGIFAGSSPAFLACMIIGTLLEGLASQLLEDVDKPIFKAVIYYAGLILQIVGVIILSVPFFGLDDGDMNFMKAVAIGWVFIILATSWYGNGFEGVASWITSYGASFIFLIIMGILSAFLSPHVLLIISTVCAGLSVVAIGVGLKIFGNNME